MQPSDITAIQSRFFQIALSTRPSAGSGVLLADALGMVVTDVDDIAQCIDIILHTPLGADPLRPDFGGDVDRYLDYPINMARPHIAREIRTALSRWEPRLNLVQVAVNPSDVAKLDVGIAWQIAAAYTKDVFVTNLAFGKLP
ncbi:MAG: GPW/gp25 family protein [Burkholderia sp.]